MFENDASAVKYFKDPRYSLFVCYRKRKIDGNKIDY